MNQPGTRFGALKCMGNLLAVLAAGAGSWLGYAQAPSSGLQIQWNLDETAGLIAADASGGGWDGMLFNFPTENDHWVEGKKGNGLSLNGNYVAVSGFPEMRSTTWSAWVKLNGTPNFSAIVSSTFAGATAGHSLGFGSGGDAMKPRIVWNHNVGSSILLSPEPVALGEWNHIALSYDAESTTLTLYVNGEEKASSGSAATTPFTSLNLGRREATGANPLNGVIDDVHIYSRALSQAEIQQVSGIVTSGPPVITRQPESQNVFAGARVEFSAQVEGEAPFSFEWRKDGQGISGAEESTFVIEEAELEDAGEYSVAVSNAAGGAVSEAAVLSVSPVDLSIGLQAHWRFEEKSGLSAADSSANENDGYLYDFAGDDAQWIEGRVGGAIAFNGANYIEVPDHPSIGADLVNGFTVATWFRSNVPLPATGGTRTSRMLEKGDAYFFLQNPGVGGMNFLVKRNGANFTASSGESLEANRWYHMAGTFDGTVIRVYLDGELKGSTTVGGSIDDANLPLRIGSDDAGAFFNGDMDEVQIWDRPLNRSEILNVMGRDLPEPPSFERQPAGMTVFAGSTATFSVDVLGKEPFRYLWHKGDDEIRTATGPALTLSDVSVSDAGSYRVQVSNEFGEAFSEAAVLTVTPVEGITTGLAAQWRFDESGGLTASDSSGAGLDGELVDFWDGLQWQPGQVNGALEFDGQGSRVVVSGSETLDVGPEASFAFWMKPAGFGTELPAGSFTFFEGRVLRKAGHFDIFVVDNPGGVRRTLIAGGVNAPQTSVELGVWQHFTVVFKGGMVRFYKDGFPIGEPRSGTLGPAGSEKVLIGSFIDGLETPRFFDGLLDEVGIWRRPLGETEILELAGKDVAGPPVIEVQPRSEEKLEGNSVRFFVIATGKRPVSYQWYRDGEEIPGATGQELVLSNLTTADAGLYTARVTNELGEALSEAGSLAVGSLDDITSGLVAYWTFDEVEGTVLEDHSGHGHHGELRNFSAVPGVAGQIGGALDFDGQAGYIAVPHAERLNLTDEGTISVWIMPRGYGPVGGGYGRVVRKSVNYDLTLIDASGGTLRFHGINKDAYDAPAGTVSLDAWQHIAITAKDGLLQYYRDGSPIGLPISGYLGEPAPDDLIIGNFEDHLDILRTFNGLMDDLGIWSRALSPADIEGIYQNGLLGQPLTAAFEPLNIRSMTWGNQVGITFFTPYPNREYAVQGKISLAGSEWTELSNVQFTSAGASLVRADFGLPAGAAGFYRIVALAAPPIFQEDFEGGAPGWTHGGGGDNWELGSPTTGPMAARGGSNVYATGLSSNYPAFADSYLHSPVVDLTGISRATLNFWEWRNTDPDPTFHGTVVNVLDAETGAVLEELSRQSGPTGNWQPRSLRLGSNSVGTRIILEFRLYSDHTNMQEGWFIDDVEIISD